MKVAGVVLAAGRSRRMGTAKALLRLEGEPFLGRVLRALRDGRCDPLVVVAGPAARAETAAIAALAREHGAAVVHNPAEDSEQIESLRLALRALPDDVAAAVTTPVDVPTVTATVVAALIGRWRDGGALIVLPTYAGEHGHPALFSRAVWPELFADDLAEGARSVIHADADRVAGVDVHEAGVLADVDTPADYERLRGGR
jgi:molybdenum cofactor cytidylyltransferase